MNKTSRKTWTSVFVAVIMLCAVLLGGQMLTLGGDAAPTSEVSLEISADKTQVVVGDTIELTFTFTTTHTDLIWESITSTVSAFADNAAATLADDSKIDESISKGLSCSIGKPGIGRFDPIAFKGAILDSDEFGELYAYDNSSADFFNGKAGDSSAYHGASLSASNKHSNNAEDFLGSNTFQFFAYLTILDGSEFPTDSTRVFPNDVEEFYLSIAQTNLNFVQLFSADTGRTTNYRANNTASFSANALKIEVRQPSDNAKLEKLWLGNTTDLDLIFDSTDVADGETFDYVYSYTYDFPGPALTDFTVKAIPEDENATMKVAFSPVPSNALASDTPLTLTISTANDPIKLYIEVTSEKGTTQMYEITVNLAFVSLQDLTATTDSTTTTATKNGLDTTTPFAPDTLEYTVFVPTDYTKVTVTPTVMADIGAKEDIALTPTQCTITPTGTVRSGSSVEVTNLEAGSTLELTATASDNTTTKTYKLVFQLVSVDTSLTVTSVVGVVTGTTFTPETPPTGVTVDYYYVLVGESNGEATVTLTAATTSTIDIDGTAYTAPTVCKGDITITVTAEAGNTKSYTMSFATLAYLQLEDSSKYQFLTERSETESSVTVYKRRAYDELGWEHGVDDLTLEHDVVLGQISQKTSILAFMANILASQRPFVKLYNELGNIVYENGAAAGDYTSDMLDSIYYSVGTGWKVTYGPEDTTADTVMLSVLGDMDGDGKVVAADAAAINRFLVGSDTFDKVEYRLAGYINNTGRITAADSASINRNITGQGTMEEYFYDPTAATP